MRYKSFRIRNFKGIQDATINFETIAGARVFTLVGLNESGKTTLLEAIHSFSPDAATSELVGGDDSTGVPVRDRVPRHLLASFTGDVSVTATIGLEEGEAQKLRSIIHTDHGIEVDPSCFSDEIVIERHHEFQNGDYRRHLLSIRTPLRVRTGRQRSWRDPSIEERKNIRDVIYGRTPDIAYFPTFVFEFPERIFLTDRGDSVDQFYRRVFQDILDHDSQGYSIERDIVRRVRSPDKTVAWASFFPIWSRDDSRDKIQQVIDRAAQAVTNMVFGRWNDIFGEDTKGKQIILAYDVLEGEIKEADGNIVKTNAHDIYIKFQIKDGTRRFNVNDRSLGFRWFFAFMLFTQFRAARKNSRSLVFLFDEPASNLHAAAQQKLIESFPEISRGGHVLIYTTHSHYMVEPKWLEQTFIVTNRADAPDSSVLDAVSLDDESLDVKVETYRSFVDKNPSKTSYFQPILDRLEVVPSKFDFRQQSIVLEGRSDYYILRYGQRLLGNSSISLIPGVGASTFGALAALSVGWNLDFVFVLDGDDAGSSAKSKYMLDFGIASDRIVTLGEIDQRLTYVEDLLDDEAKDKIRDILGITGRPTKPQLKRFFQERLAADDVVSLGKGFSKSVRALLDALGQKLGSPPTTTPAPRQGTRGKSTPAKSPKRKPRRG